LGLGLNTYVRLSLLGGAPLQRPGPLLVVALRVEAFSRRFLLSAATVQDSSVFFPNSIKVCAPPKLLQFHVSCIKICRFFWSAALFKESLNVFPQTMDDLMDNLQRVLCAGTGNARRSADAIPRHLQGQNRIHVRRRSLACVEQWRRGSPDHLPCRGRELFPKFSPDGKWIAFTAQYDGNFNVYIIPSDGGQPKQLTFYQGSATPLSDRMGIHNEVVTWFPDSKRIVFLSRRDASNGWTKRLYSVSIEGGLPEPFPMDQGGLASFSPDGTRIAYNQIFRNFRTWKRYTGGLAQDITIYNLKNNTVDAMVPHTEWVDSFPLPAYPEGPGM